MIDLLPFCSKEPTRLYLHKPFSRDEFTYATNGHIMVRVARLAEFPEQEKPNPEPIFADCERSADMRPLPKFDFPTPITEECAKCHGTGYEHDCPSCECECPGCDGTGHYIENISVAINTAIFNAKYYRLLLALPNVQVPVHLPESAGMFFTFDGGEGVLMPMRLAFAKHFTTEAAT